MTYLKFSTKVKSRAASFQETASIIGLKITLFSISTQKKMLKKQEVLTSNSMVNLSFGFQFCPHIVEDVATQIITQKIAKRNTTHRPRNMNNCTKDTDQLNIGHAPLLEIQLNPIHHDINHPVIPELPKIVM